MKKTGKLTRQIIIKDWTKERTLEFLDKNKWIELRLNCINEKIYGEIIILKKQQ